MRLLNFNSILVQLEEIAELLNDYVADGFQFHIGAIRSRYMRLMAVL